MIHYRTFCNLASRSALDDERGRAYVGVDLWHVGSIVDTNESASHKSQANPLAVAITGKVLE